MTKDRAEVGNLEKLLSTIGEGLDRYLEFKHDDAVVNIDSWKAALDQPLPQQGSGIEQVTRDLVEHVIANGSSVSKPGFTSYITTGATTASTLAMTAASIASPQRY
ncbi:MAG: aromatic-L-amino-acid decarboxylase [Planctomycetota bacterium]|jgi:aromatic-L-amino-acid decarboxylase